MFKVYLNLSILAQDKVHRLILHEVSSDKTIMESINDYLQSKFGLNDEWCRVSFGTFSCTKPGEICVNYLGILPERLNHLIDDTFV